MFQPFSSIPAIVTSEPIFQFFFVFDLSFFNRDVKLSLYLFQFISVICQTVAFPIDDIFQNSSDPRFVVRITRNTLAWNEHICAEIDITRTYFYISLSIYTIYNFVILK